jgi:membrane protease subunit HflK
MTPPSTNPALGPGHADALDPANQMVAEALRKSFRVLKLLMFVLIVLYFLSGWFSVKPSEQAVVLRYGRIVAGGPGETRSPVLGPGWHWSWPYPIDRWETVSTRERSIEVPFLYQFTEEEQTGGITGYKYGPLSPARDDYLITGDVNILHASLVVVYKITDPVAYLTHVFPMPDPKATPRSKPSLHYPEYALMTDLVRNAVIETAAHRTDLEIRGARQSDFLAAALRQVNHSLHALAAAGTPVGITLDPATGLIAPKTGGVEGLFPPRQVQEAFENVDKALAQKVIMITRATSDAQSLLVRTAGLDYAPLGEAVAQEFSILRQASAARPGSPEATAAQDALARQRAKVEELLVEAGGDVRHTIKKGEIRRDQTLKEAAGDYDQFRAVLPEYERNPTIFVSQLLADAFANALANDRIAKLFVPENVSRYWITVPRATPPQEDLSKPREQKPGVIEEEPYIRVKPM